MSQRNQIGFGGVTMGVVELEPEALPRPDARTPFRIAVLGDFSGRAHRGLHEPETIGRRRPIEIDRDTFDDVLARLAPEVRLNVGRAAGALALGFRELDDFHPDRMVERLGLFDELRRLRRRLHDPSSFAAAAAEVAAWAKPAAPAAAPSPATPAAEPAAKTEGFTTDDLFAALSETSPSPTPGAPPARPAPPNSGSELADRLIEEVVGPYVIPAPDPRQDDLIAAVDRATGAQLAALLHDPAFQALEAAWRGLDLLVRRVETDARLKIFLVDVTTEELAADLAAGDGGNSGFYKLIVEPSVETEGGQPWAVLAGAYTFPATAEAAVLLGRLGALAARAGAPFLAGADSRLVGAPDLAATPDPDDWTVPLDAAADSAWRGLRAGPAAAWIALLLPRVLLRLPYGKRSDPVESFAFEEMPAEGSGHAAYLWGNPALVAVCLLAQAFSQSGWALRPGEIAELDDLPLHIRTEDGEAVAQPCAEILLTERGAARFAACGVIPVFSVRDRDAVRLGPFRPLAADRRTLPGRWG